MKLRKFKKAQEKAARDVQRWKGGVPVMDASVSGAATGAAPAAGADEAGEAVDTAGGAVAVEADVAVDVAADVADAVEAVDVDADQAERIELAETMYRAAQARFEAAEALEQAATERLRAAEAAEQAATERLSKAEDGEQAIAERLAAADDRERAAAERIAAAEVSEQAIAGRLAAAEARERAAGDRDVIANQRDRTAAERDAIANERDRAAVERGGRSTGRETTPPTTPQNGTSAAHELEIARLEAELERAHLDSLTGALRREIGRLTLHNEIERARRNDGRFVLAFIDVDDLKGINDREGHAAGDRVLRTLAATLRANLRTYDPVVRYGGDEFVCGVTGVSAAELEHRVTLIDQSLRRATGVGISAGLATLREGETLDEITARADEALLEAKRNRDR